MKTKNILSIFLSIVYLIVLAFSLSGFFANIFGLLDTNLSLLFIPELEYEKITHIFSFVCFIVASWGYFVWENTFSEKLNYVWVVILIILIVEGCIGIVRDIPTSINIYAAVFGHVEVILYLSFLLTIVYVESIESRK